MMRNIFNLQYRSSQAKSMGLSQDQPLMVNYSTYSKCQKQTRCKLNESHLNSGLLSALLTQEIHVFHFFTSKYSLMQLLIGLKLNLLEVVYNKITSILPQYCSVFNLGVDLFIFDSEKGKQSVPFFFLCNKQPWGLDVGNRILPSGPFSWERKSLAKKWKILSNLACCNLTLE